MYEKYLADSRLYMTTVISVDNKIVWHDTFESGQN